MKKVAIATAVAAVMASSAAIADVSVSGRFNVAYQDEDGAADARLDSQGLNSSSRLNFMANEDLGNGMTAYMHTTMKYNVVGGGDVENFYGWTGVKGDFGDVRIGKHTGPRYALAEGFFDWTRAVPSAGGGSKEDSSISYINKFGDISFQATMGMDGDGTDEMSGLGVLAPVGPVNIHVTVENDANALGGEGVEQTDLGVSYADGPLSAAIAFISTDNNGAEEDTTVIQAAYKMDMTKFAVQMTMLDEADIDSTVIGVYHNMSKKVQVYLENNSGDIWTEETAIGMIMFF
jgi:predicted porin